MERTFAAARSWPSPPEPAASADLASHGAAATDTAADAATSCPPGWRGLARRGARSRGETRP
eukprot:356617-Chlamydomonas_euryale.AAC.5